MNVLLTSKYITLSPPQTLKISKISKLSIDISRHLRYLTCPSFCGVSISSTRYYCISNDNLDIQTEPNNTYILTSIDTLNV